MTAPSPTDDPTTAPYFAGCAVRELRVQQCASCGHHQLYPRPLCLACGARAPIWVAAAGTGTVYSRTRVERPARGDLTPPYLVGLVELDEGPRLLTLLTDDAAIGERVRVAWRDRSDGPPLPVFGRA